MYLKMLEDEEKQCFLVLAKYLSSSDGEVSDKEIEYLNMYKQEAEVDDVSSNLTHRDAVEQIKSNSSVASKKMILFELVGLALADEKYAKDEREFLICLANDFEIDATYIDRCINLVDKYFSLLREINQIVLE